MSQSTNRIDTRRTMIRETIHLATQVFAAQFNAMAQGANVAMPA